MIVTVDGEPTPCHNMTCDFTYVEPVGKVESATFDLATKKLVVTGIDIPTTVKPTVTELTGTYGAASAAAASTTPAAASTTSTDSSSGGGRRLTSCTD